MKIICNLRLRDNAPKIASKEMRLPCIWNAALLQSNRYPIRILTLPENEKSKLYASTKTIVAFEKVLLPLLMQKMSQFEFFNQFDNLVNHLPWSLRCQET